MAMVTWTYSSPPTVNETNFTSTMGTAFRMLQPRRGRPHLLTLILPLTLTPTLSKSDPNPRPNPHPHPHPHPGPTQVNPAGGANDPDGDAGKAQRR